jgi:3',5'-cyclic AMP phosphodiesterase CpdA
MRIVLLGDLHLYRLFAWPWELMSKRLLGQMNLWLNRRRHFNMKLLPDVIAKVRDIHPDMILCSGDLTTTAHPLEFRMVRKRLGPLFDQYPTFLSPGNHDRYTFTSKRRGLMERLLGELTTEDWPHHRRISQHLHLIALDPARPAMIGDRGRIGTAQLAALSAILQQLGPDDRAIVLCHYTLGSPPGSKPEKLSHGLRDLPQLLNVLSRPLPILFLHGHIHQPACFRHHVAPNIVAVNAGAPLLIGPRWPRGQGIWEIDTGEVGPTAVWQLVHHAMDSSGQWHAQIVTPPNEPGAQAPVSLR